jgi:hypothetical protein
MNIIIPISKIFSSLFRASYSTTLGVITTVGFVSTIIGGLLAKSNLSIDIQTQLATYVDDKVCKIATALKVNYKLCEKEVARKNENEVFWNQIRGKF